MKVLTFGTFDCPHMGHAVFLRQCSRLGAVAVALRSDDMIRTLRGHDPVFTYAERSDLVKALGYDVIQSGEPGAMLIRITKPDILAVGSDWATKDVWARYGITPAELDDLGTTLVYLPYTPHISTTELKRRLS